MVRQLKRDGTLGDFEAFGFVDSKTLIERLKKDGSNMTLTVGLSFRNPKTKDKLMDNIAAIRWLRRAGDFYSYQATYADGEDLMRVTALSGNDLV